MASSNDTTSCYFAAQHCRLSSFSLCLFLSSIQTLVKISKTAGARLKPHASRLIPALLEALSTLEPQVLNYLSLRATEQEKVTSGTSCLFTPACKFLRPVQLDTYRVLSPPLQSAMDAARLSAAKSSPMMETINMVRQRPDQYYSVLIARFP